MKKRRVTQKQINEMNEFTFPTGMQTPDIASSQFAMTVTGKQAMGNMKQPTLLDEFNVFTRGQHEGSHITDVPYDYLVWVMEQGNIILSTQQREDITALQPSTSTPKQPKRRKDPSPYIGEELMLKGAHKGKPINSVPKQYFRTLWGMILKKKLFVTKRDYAIIKKKVEK